jgi:hypothetical protein
MPCNSFAVIPVNAGIQFDLLLRIESNDWIKMDDDREHA